MLGKKEDSAFICNYFCIEVKFTYNEMRNFQGILSNLDKCMYARYAISSEDTEPPWA